MSCMDNTTRCSSPSCSHARNRRSWVSCCSTQLRRLGAGIEPGLVLRARPVVGRVGAELDRRGARASQLVDEDPIHHAQRPRPHLFECAQLREPWKQPHQQLLHEVFGAIDRAGPAIRGSIQRGDVGAQQPLEFRGVAGAGAGHPHAVQPAHALH